MELFWLWELLDVFNEAFPEDELLTPDEKLVLVRLEEVD
jgi:hypothetical protein